MPVSTEQRARLRGAREALVVEHMESENRHEFDVTLATFDHPRYELVATGDVYDGTEEVARCFEASQRPGASSRCGSALPSCSTRTDSSASASTSMPERSCASWASPTIRYRCGGASRRCST